jgi:large exoprotein involved in heme utilization and adhesion
VSQNKVIRRSCYLLGQGIVGLQQDNDLLHLQFPAQVTKSDVSINKQSQVIVRGAGGGDVAINARNLVVSDHSLVRAGIDLNSGTPDTQAGNVEINADTVTLSNVGVISNNVESGGVGKAGRLTINANRLSLIDGSQLQVVLRSANYIPGLPGAQGTGGTLNLNISGPVLISGISRDGLSSDIFSSVGGFSQSGFGTAEGKGGDINIRADSLTVQDNASIISSTHGKGDAGNVLIQVNGDAVFSKGFIFADVNASGVGKAGRILLQARSLTLKNDSRISSGIYPPQDGRPGGQGQGSFIRIDATDFVNIFGLASGIDADTGHDTIGRGGDILINTNAFRISNGGAINTDTFNASDAGNITINARTFSALNNGKIVASTHASGNAGNITINATDSLTIAEPGPAFGSGIVIIGPGGSAPAPDRNLPSAIYANVTSESKGNGGNIVVNTTRLSVSAGGFITAQNQGTGRAGNVTIAAHDSFKAQDGSILTSAKLGGGGNINISAKNILLQGNSDIRTDLAQGQGTGGSITLKANTIVALNDSDILAFAPQGQGGNITFKTSAFLSSPLYRSTTNANLTSLNTLDGNRRVDVNASGSVTGTVVGVPDISFLQNSLTLLPQTLVNSDTLLANSCIARNRQGQGTFHISGTSSLPERPGDAGITEYPTGSIRSIHFSFISQ